MANRNEIIMRRKPIAAGTFYAGGKEALKRQIQQCFLHDLGPQKIPQLGNTKTIKGVVVPHAGYQFSGPVAAHAYAEIARDGFPDTFIILGPNHTGYGSAVSMATEGEWETPLGTLAVNEKIANKMWKGLIDRDDDAHRYEHSIEVQLPFLQFFSKCQIVPICMGLQDYETAKEIGEIIASAATDAIIMASTDFSHVGMHYMQMTPPGTPVNKWAEQQDDHAIKKIMALDDKGLIETVANNNISMCGYGCVAAMLTAVKKLGATKAELLKYATSYEIQPGESCVGYGAFALR